MMFLLLIVKHSRGIILAASSTRLQARTFVKAVQTRRDNYHSAHMLVIHVKGQWVMLKMLQNK